MTDNLSEQVSNGVDKNVTIYSTPTCHFCQMTKDFLKEKGIAYTDFDVAHDLEKRQEMIQKSGQMGVPVIFIGNEMIIGFDQERLVSTLGLPAQAGITA
ncbi:MAG: Glutaredoxin-like protein, YruB-family [Parcubacteria group bacterium GW2011_GWA1_54_9]|nr:MAG: Glutaredoxin-like protein, YruB-family [Parcubacteria group bacterium GW2011_GWA1_54_9]